LVLDDREVHAGAYAGALPANVDDGLALDDLVRAAIISFASSAAIRFSTAADCTWLMNASRMLFAFWRTPAFAATRESGRRSASPAG